MPARVETSVLARRLAAALAAPGGPRAGEHLLVAVSGGPDSTALLAALAELAPGHGLRLTAAHVDHGLRGVEGAAEADAVAALAARLGVPFVGQSVAVPAGPDLEARARRARYRALARVAAEVGAGRIGTGHTQDDQVETVLLPLLRGAGPPGPSGARSPSRGPRASCARATCWRAGPGGRPRRPPSRSRSPLDERSPTALAAGA